MQVTLNRPLTPQTAQARSVKHYKLSFRSVAVHLAVQDGDTLESLSLESGFSKAKLQEANGGELSQTPPGIQVLLHFICGVHMLMSAS